MLILKNIVVIIFFLLIENCLFAQKKEIIGINDIRNKGLNEFDTASIGHNIGDVYIVRYSTLNYLEGRNDTISLYKIHVIKSYKMEPKNYSLLVYSKQGYNKAFYKWKSNSVLSIRFFNSENNNEKQMKIYVPSSSCCILDVKKGVIKNPDYDK